MPDGNGTRHVWSRLGGVEPATLVDSRLALHYAAQPLASFGQALIEPRKDDSHRSSTWVREEGTLITDESAQGLQARLVVPDFALALDRDGEELTALHLRGKRPSEALGWLGGALLDAAGADVTLSWPEYDLPERPEGHDGPMVPVEAALGELCAWFDNADAALEEAFADRPEASTLRCWPHHFDLGTLLTFHPGADGEATYVGAGLSPGDEGRPHPYYYVNGWPAPEPDALPALDGPGRWNTEGWVGGVLDAEEVVARSDPEDQQSMVRDFLHAAASAMQSSVTLQR